METLSNGFKKPETGDRGGEFFPALEENIQQVNDHNHNGSNSEKLNSEAIIALTDEILPASWVLHTNGLYRAALVMPGSLEFDSKQISLRANGSPLYGEIEKITSNSFYVYVNDNTLTVQVIY